MERLNTACRVMGSHALVAAKLIAHLSDGRLKVFEGRWVIMGGAGPTV